MSFQHPETTIIDRLFEGLLRNIPEISPNLRRTLLSYPPNTRKQIVCHQRSFLTPLFVAVSNNAKKDIIRFLVKDCYADVEQKCLLKIEEIETTRHIVTPLWCACIKGFLPIIQVLVEIGKADVNASSDSGSTPLRSACYMNRIDVVKYLLEKGADVNIPNVHGGTCLINSVQNIDLIKLLIKHGACINAQDMHGKTALHYAVQENRLDTVTFLMESGSDVTLKTAFGDDAIQTSAIMGLVKMFEPLAQSPKYSFEHIANQYELLGSSILEKIHDMSVAVHFWLEAITLRKEKRLPKQHLQNHCLTSFGLDEFNTPDDIELIRYDSEVMHLNSLLISERVLGVTHRETIYRLLYRGAVYADLNEFNKCLLIWIYVLEIRLRSDAIFHPDTVFTGKTICIVLNEMSVKYKESIINEPINMSIIMRIAKVMAKEMPAAISYLNIKPSSVVQEQYFKKTLMNMLYLFHVSFFTEHPKDTEIQEFRCLLYTLLKMNPVTNSLSTLLHLCLDSSTFGYYHPKTTFPCLNVTKLLIETGSNLNARDILKNTPLHLAALLPEDFIMIQIIKMLLRNGSHYDAMNKLGREAGITIIGQTWSYPLKNVNLKCLASIAIIKYNIPVNELRSVRQLLQYMQLH